MNFSLAAIQFLPRGKGALILILGGLVILAFVFLFGRLFSGPAPKPPLARKGTSGSIVLSGAGRGARALRMPAASHPSIEPGPRTGTKDWVAGLEYAVEHMHLGQGHIMSADAEHCLFSLAGCATCRKAGHQRHTCERERDSIQHLVAAVAPDVLVKEVTCDVAGTCTFEISRPRHA